MCSHVYCPLFLLMFSLSFFFFNDPAPTEIYTLSLHDALPIWTARQRIAAQPRDALRTPGATPAAGSPESTLPSSPDRKSTRLNSSHRTISYAVFCLKKKKKYKRKNNKNSDKSNALLLEPTLVR